MAAEEKCTQTFELCRCGVVGEHEVHICADTEGCGGQWEGNEGEEVPVVFPGGLDQRAALRKALSMGWSLDAASAYWATTCAVCGEENILPWWAGDPRPCAESHTDEQIDKAVDKALEERWL